MTNQAHISCVRYGYDRMGCTVVFANGGVAYFDGPAGDEEAMKASILEYLNAEPLPPISDEAKARQRALHERRRATEHWLRDLRDALHVNVAGLSEWERGIVEAPADVLEQWEQVVSAWEDRPR